LGYTYLLSKATNNHNELLDAVYIYDKHAGPISYDFWLDISNQVEWVCDHWRTPMKAFGKSGAVRENFFTQG
jgi:hypothetical protein